MTSKVLICLLCRRTNVGRYGFVSHEPIDYMNILPEDNRLAEVSSNIWGTKFKILGVNLEHVPSLLGQINYKASLLHLQPRQMRLEIMDLKEDNSDLELDLDADDESWLEEKSDGEEDKNTGSTTGMFISDAEEDATSESATTNKAVTMKDDILTACVPNQTAPPPPNVAPIAPLPSRLSFCLSPQRQQQLDTMIEHHQKASVVIESSQESSPAIISPNKKFTGESGGCAISSMVAVKRSPTVSFIK